MAQGSLGPSDSVSQTPSFDGGVSVTFPGPMSDLTESLSRANDASSQALLINRYFDAYDAYLKAHTGLGFVASVSSKCDVDGTSECSVESIRSMAARGERRKSRTKLSDDKSGYMLPNGLCYCRCVKDGAREGVALSLGMWPRLTNLLAQHEEVMLTLAETASLVVKVVGGNVHVLRVGEVLVDGVSVFPYNVFFLEFCRGREFPVGSYGAVLARSGGSRSLCVLPSSTVGFRVGGSGALPVLEAEMGVLDLRSVAVLPPPRVVVRQHSRACGPFPGSALPAASLVTLSAFASAYVRSCVAVEVSVVDLSSAPRLAGQVVALAQPGGHLWGRKKLDQLLRSGPSVVHCSAESLFNPQVFSVVCRGEVEVVVEKCAGCSSCLAGLATSAFREGILRPVPLLGNGRRVLRVSKRFETLRKLGGPLDRPELLTNVLAVDCEMMTADRKSPFGKNILGRLSLVNWFGQTVYDTFVYPTDCVVQDTNLRWGSGITKADIKPQNGATGFDRAREKFLSYVSGRVLVGFSLHSDLNVLRVDSSTVGAKCVDVQRLEAYRPVGKQFASLKSLAMSQYNVCIQAGQHSSVEDAAVTMALYRSREGDALLQFGLGSFVDAL